MKLAAFHAVLKTASTSTTGEHEVMTMPRLRQTLIDLPVAAVAGGIGYGVGMTIGEQIGNVLAARGVRAAPMAKRWAPHVLAGATAMGSYMFGQARERMRQRRDEAEQKAAGVEPAPQSRGIPRKKPTDPWRYDPRPVGWT